MDVWALLLIPIITCVTIVFITLKWKNLSSFLSIAAVIACFLIVLPYLIEALGNPHMQGYEQAFTWLKVKGLRIEIGTFIDSLTVVMLCIVTFVGSLIHIYARGYMEGEEGFSRFFACLSFFIFAMLGIVLANNLIMIFIFWELVGLASYLLIGYYYQKPSAADAAKKAFLVNRVGDFGLILGIFVIYYATGTFNFGEIEHQVMAGHVAPETIGLAALLLFCGAVGKSAQFPLHVWLPDAMEGPTPVSALIHAATMVAAGVYLLVRVSFLFYMAPPVAGLVVAYVGGLTALMAALMALAQSDIKKIIAYSTLSSLGYMVMSVGLGGTGAGMFYLMTHAFFKALLFLGAGSVIHACHTNSVWEMGRLYPKMKATAITFILGALAMMGVFPFAGFWSKDEILSTAFSSGHWLLYGAGTLTAFITGIFITKIVILAFFGKKRHHGQPHESVPSMVIPLVVLSVFAVVAGFAGFPGLEPNFGSFIPSHGHHGHHEFNFLVAGLSTLVVFAGIVVGWKLYTGEAEPAHRLKAQWPCFYKVLENKFYFDHFYDGVLVGVIYNGIGTIFNYIEVNIFINFFINGFAYLVRLTGRAMRGTVTGQLQHYSLYMVSGVVVLVLIFLQYFV